MDHYQTRQSSRGLFRGLFRTFVKFNQVSAKCEYQKRQADIDFVLRFKAQNDTQGLERRGVLEILFLSS